MATVSNVTHRTLVVAGHDLGPFQLGVEIDVSADKLRNHLFARSGWITVEGKTVAVGSPSPAPEESDSDGKPTLADAKKEAAETQDLDRLEELAKDDRKTVSKIAQDRLAELNAE